MNEKCHKLYGLLAELKTRKAEYDTAYARALAKGDFSEIGKLMAGLKLGIKDLDEELVLMRLNEMPKKLKEALSEENYKEALATAREFDPSIKAPSRHEIIKRIYKLGAEKMASMETIMSKPGLIITPANQWVEQLIEKMNNNRHFENQNECSLGDDHQWSGPQEKVGVSIVDMEQYAESLPNQRQVEEINSKQFLNFEKYFKANGLKMIHDYEYLVAMQRSLRAYEQAKKAGEDNPERHVLDVYGIPNATVSILNQEFNSEHKVIAYGLFSAQLSDVHLNVLPGERKRHQLRGRAAMKVI